MQLNIRDAQRLLYQAVESLSPTASLDAQVLLAHILGKTRAWVLAHPDAKLDEEQVIQFEQASARLGTGEPLPYILGSWEFFGLEFTVTPDVLIPRPETELLVEHALGWLSARPGRRRAADVGTGSGCIAISMASQIPDLQVIATDISPAALRVAKQNTLHHGLEHRIHLVQANLFTGIRPTFNTQFDLICANLPYIPEHTLETLSVSHWEPRLALCGGDNGLDLILRLLMDVPDKLSPGGILLLEIESSLGQAVVSLVRSVLPDTSVSVLPDLAGHDRLVVCQN
jgi:release factor glutamine methyltransferase